MNFELQFNFASNVRIAPKEYDEEVDDVGAMLFDICDAIDGEAEFIFDGFGQARWPVDVHTDLPIFLIQLPETISAIAAGGAIRLDFYEQGVERKIDFSLAGSDYACRCSTWTDWQPSPDIEYIDQKALLETLMRFRNRFVVIIEEVAPHLLSSSLFKEWLK